MNTYVAAPAFLSSSHHLLAARSPSTSSACHRVQPSMLRVSKHRRPPQSPGLSGRFLPFDPGDEAILDELESEKRTFRAESTEDGRGEDGSTGTSPEKTVWSRRSEAAKKRWADPTYRAKMLKKRRRKVEAAGKVRIGSMDSITLSGDEKAREINDYVRSCKRRSESLAAFHRDGAAWMKKRLDDGEDLRRGREVEGLLKRRERRREVARKRHEARRQKASEEGDSAKALDVDGISEEVTLPKKRGRPSKRTSSVRTPGDG